MSKRANTTTAAIHAHLVGCVRSQLLIMSTAVRNVRASVQDCELTDDELAQLIALHAVAAGFNVISFDLKARRYTIELPVACKIPGWPVSQKIGYPRDGGR